MSSLKAKIALITGAAQGVGRELCLRLCLDEGYEVYGLDREAQKLTELEALIASKGGIFKGYAVDITRADQITDFANGFTSTHRGLELLINNAGVVYGGEFEKTSIDRHLQTYRINTEGYVRMTHAFLPLLRVTPQSQLIFMASVTGLSAVPYLTTYASSKWAVVGFAESLRAELRALKVQAPHIGVICPSTISTGLFEGTKPPLFMPLLTPQTVAAAVIQGIRKKKSRVYAPFFSRFAPLLNTLLPQWLLDRVSDCMGVTHAVREWTGRSPDLIAMLKQYAARYPDQRTTAEDFIRFLKTPEERPYHRENLTRHVTSSAWVIDPSGEEALLTHHRKLDVWVQLGGHCDGSSHVLESALREATEESGIEGITAIAPEIFDLDKHLIGERKGEPQHFHYDIRFLLRAPHKNFIVSPESKALRWVHYNDVFFNRADIEAAKLDDSVKRMHHKWKQWRQTKKI